MHLLILTFVDSHHFPPVDLLLVQKNWNISDCLTNALHMIYELNVKTHTRVMSCVCFMKVDIFVTAKEQMYMMDKLRMRTGAWFMLANITEENILWPKDLRLTMFCESVDVSQTAAMWTSPWLTGCVLPSSICVCTTKGCKCVLSLHESLCIISLKGEKGDSCQVQKKMLHKCV